MRITREKLLKLAKTQAAMRVMQNRRLVCVYLTGSLLDEEPLLGGTADIDLIFVHDTPPPQEREIVPLSAEVHLDIAHVSQEQYQQPRSLRSDAWLGSFLCHNPLVLHERGHWFEFVQAGVCAHFYRPETILQRVQPQLDAARQGWMTLQSAAGLDVFQRTALYLRTLRQTANAVACLCGPPLTERRLLLHFPQRAQAVRRPELSAGLIALLSGGTDLLAEAQTPQWFETWQTALGDAGQTSQHPPSLHPARWAYYTRAAQALWSETPAAALWIVLRTWCAALDCLPADHASRPSFVSLCRSLALDPLEERLEALDVYLDTVEEMIEGWAKENGL
jgi:hypothetical protein